MRFPLSPRPSDPEHSQSAGSGGVLLPEKLNHDISCIDTNMTTQHKQLSSILFAAGAALLFAATLCAQDAITTIAGTGASGFGGDNGPATSALLNSPSAVTIGSGVIYFCDTQNNRIRAVDHGTITTVAGTGAQGFSGDGGPAISATFNHPTGIAFSTADASIYIAD